MNKPTTIDEYISDFPKNVQAIPQQIRATIKETAPEAKETIAYGIPTFTLNGNLVHFGAFKNHIGFYPTPSGINEFKEELSKYKSAKGSVQFPLDKEMPLNLIRKIVQFRINKNSNKKKSSASK